MSDEIVDRILTLFAERGDAAYIGEAVSQTEHALQTAHLAEAAGSPATLIAAALVHDIGHLVDDHAEDSAERGVDARHEALGSRWLARYFGPAVVVPGALHVAAKRYLCAVDPHYLSRLSPASVQSLGLQGGPMDRAEVEAFDAAPYAADAVRLRRWDDEAKIVGWSVPPLEHYRAVLVQALSDAPPEKKPV
ncbi:MAG TPA: HD domain-containing protein [Gemmatimonadaceae bacterium]|nr:HD domain-containing protein [Gemmatimonadaceae bacterium]